MATFNWKFLWTLSVALIAVLFPINTRAKDIPYGHSVPSTLRNGDTWLWRVSYFEGLKTLEIYTGDHIAKTDVPMLSADISDCSFCRGDEDNCSEDGIDVLQVSRHPAPFVRVVCHVGAHSQRLMIFAPRKDSKNPVFQRTGVYWLRSSRTEHELSVSYDKSGFGLNCPDGQPSADGICEVSESWPHPDAGVK